MGIMESNMGGLYHRPGAFDCLQQLHFVFEWLISVTTRASLTRCKGFLWKLQPPPPAVALLLPAVFFRSVPAFSLSIYMDLPFIALYILDDRHWYWIFSVLIGCAAGPHMGGHPPGNKARTGDSRAAYVYI